MQFAFSASLRRNNVDHGYFRSDQKPERKYFAGAQPHVYVCVHRSFAVKSRTVQAGCTAGAYNCAEPRKSDLPAMSVAGEEKVNAV